MTGEDDRTGVGRPIKPPDPPDPVIAALNPSALTSADRRQGSVMKLRQAPDTEVSDGQLLEQRNFELCIRRC